MTARLANAIRLSVFPDGRTIVRHGMTGAVRPKARNQVEKVEVVGAEGFELSTYGTQNRRATRLRYAPTAVILPCRHTEACHSAEK